MDENKLSHLIKAKRSFLCVGLDTDIRRVPKHLQNEFDPVFEFNKRIINATRDYAVAYKLNTAFYEARGVEGWRSFERTFNILPNECLLICDGKRSDIGNTAEQYATAYYETFPFHGQTINPYLGLDAVKPYLNVFEKWGFVLALTSNPGARDFQCFKDANGRRLFEKVIEDLQAEKHKGILGFVIGATHKEEIQNIRKLIPDKFLLLPGIGIQGGDMETCLKHTVNHQGGVLINVSRAILYAGTEKDFEAKAETIAEEYVNMMQAYV